MMTRLVDQRCLPQDGQGRMTPYEIRIHLKLLSGWSDAEGAIEKVYAFANFHETIAFVNALAWVAQREDHHPDFSVSHDRCAVRLSTHAVGGLSINDFVCAAKLDALLT